jgi:hypothetical protein
VHQGDEIELLDEGKWDDMQSADGSSKKVLKFQAVLPNGEIKGYSMNNTTIDNMTFAYGKDSKNWKRKPLKVWIDRRQSFGKWVDVLILTPTDWPSFAPQENTPTINVGTQPTRPAPVEPEEFNYIPE